MSNVAIGLDWAYKLSVDWGITVIYIS